MKVKAEQVHCDCAAVVVECVWLGRKGVAKMSIPEISKTFLKLGGRLDKGRCVANIDAKRIWPKVSREERRRIVLQMLPIKESQK